MCVRGPRCHHCRLHTASVPGKWHTQWHTQPTPDRPELRGRACVAQHEPRGRAAPLFHGRRTNLARAARLRTANAYLGHDDLLGRQLGAQVPRRPQSLAAGLTSPAQGSSFDPESFGFRALAYHRQVRGGAPCPPGCGSKHDRTATSMASLQQCLKLYTGA